MMVEALQCLSPASGKLLIVKAHVGMAQDGMGRLWGRGGGGKAITSKPCW
jgi:hypothetical protein